MTAPLVVSPSTKTPGFYLLVDLLAGSSGAGTGVLKVLIMAPKGSGGDATVDTEVRLLGGPDGAADFFQAGTPGHLAAKAIFAREPLAQVYGLAPTASAGAVASATHTFAGTPSDNTVIRFDIHGFTIDVPWAASEALATFRTRAIAAINAQSANIFVVASAGAGAGDIDLDAKVAGPWGNDVLTGAKKLIGGTGVTVTPASALATGTTEPNFTTALTTINASEYPFILACLSNADATDATASSNAQRLATHIDTYRTGLGALLQVGIVGHTGTQANAKAGAIGRNFEAMQYVYGQAFQDLPSVVGACELADALHYVSLRASYNRIGNRLNLVGAKDKVADKLTPAELEDLLNNGVTPLSYADGTGHVVVVRPITTHSLSGGNPDFRCFDMSETYATFAIARDLRVNIPAEFANASISPNLPAGADPLPAGVVEIKDVRAKVISRMRFHARNGLCQAAALDAAVLDGSLSVEINGTDPTQVDTYIPATIVKPLAKIGAYVAKQ